MHFKDGHILNADNTNRQIGRCISMSLRCKQVDLIFSNCSVYRGETFHARHNMSLLFIAAGKFRKFEETKTNLLTANQLRRRSTVVGVVEFG